MCSSIRCVKVMKEEVLARISKYVTDCFHRDAPDYLFYHNLAHTEAVVRHAEEIGKFYQLDDDSLRILLAASWFHDIGHLYTVPEEHEYRSVSVMTEFLKDECPPETIRQIEQLILATRMPAKPVSLSEQIICDADTYHFGTPDFAITDDQVKKEMEHRMCVVFTSWTERALHLLKNHRFFTAYCREKLDEGKKANIAYLENKLSTT